MLNVSLSREELLLGAEFNAVDRVVQYFIKTKLHVPRTRTTTAAPMKATWLIGGG